MRSVFYGVLLTVFFVCAGSVQAANDEYERGISGEGPAFKPKPPLEDLFGDEVFVELEEGGTLTFNSEALLLATIFLTFWGDK